MRANESTQPNSVLSRLFGGLALAVFLAWYVLPNCQCQWNVLFGDVNEDRIPDDPAFTSDDSGTSDETCHCDDQDNKTFLAAQGLEAPAHLSHFVFASSSPVDSLTDRIPVEVLARGPPLKERPLPQRSRTYLRHRSLLL